MRTTEIALFALVFLTLTMVTYGDGYPVRHRVEGVNPHAAEALIYGRLAKSEKDGILSSRAFLGQCSRGESLLRWNTDFQRELYEADRCDRFTAYYSQSGLQGVLFSTLDQLRMPVAGFRLISAASMAVALTLLFAWVASHFGVAAALTGIALTLLHRWPMLLGDNLFMGFGLMYLPMVALCLALRRGARRVLLLTSVCLTIRWLMTGAEFLFAGLLMTFVPLVFYAVKGGWSRRELLGLALQVSAGTLISLAICGTVLVFQIASQSSFENAKEHFTYTVGKRTWGDPENYPKQLESGLSAPGAEVMRTYLGIPAIEIGGISLTFREIFILETILTVFVAAICWDSRSRSLLAFIAVTWASVIPPLSWILIAKAHAHRHVWVDPIVWYMPFLLLCNALTGITLARTPGFTKGILQRLSGSVSRSRNARRAS